jgi:hypothetical protein
MMSFIILYFFIDNDINSELKNIMRIDVVSTVVLCITLILFLLKSNLNTMNFQQTKKSPQKKKFRCEYNYL